MLIISYSEKASAHIARQRAKLSLIWDKIYNIEVNVHTMS